jgi:hypothetical protein
VVGLSLHYPLSRRDSFPLMVREGRVRPWCQNKCRKVSEPTAKSRGSRIPRGVPQERGGVGKPSPARSASGRPYGSSTDARPRHRRQRDAVRHRRPAAPPRASVPRERGASRPCLPQTDHPARIGNTNALRQRSLRPWVPSP